MQVRNYEGVNELAGEGKSPLLSRGGVARSAGVVLVKKFYGTGPAPPRLRVYCGFAKIFESRIHPSSAEEGNFSMTQSNPGGPVYADRYLSTVDH